MSYTWVLTSRLVPRHSGSDFKEVIYTFHQQIPIIAYIPPRHPLLPPPLQNRTRNTCCSVLPVIIIQIFPHINFTLNNIQNTSKIKIPMCLIYLPINQSEFMYYKDVTKHKSMCCYMYSYAAKLLLYLFWRSLPFLWLQRACPSSRLAPRSRRQAASQWWQAQWRSARLSVTRIWPV